MQAPGVVDVGAEFMGADFGDARLGRRVVSVVRAIQRNPSATFPEAFRDASALEAYYRLTNNERVKLAALQDAHADAGWDRAVASKGRVLVVHDTTEHRFEGDSLRQGLAVRGQRQGFHSHLAAAVAETGPILVHGVVGVGHYGVKDGRWHPLGLGARTPPLEVGSQRWGRMAREVEQSAPLGLDLVHVMDREGDAFELLADLGSGGHGFVVRASHDRRTVSGGATSERLAVEPFEVTREVYLGARSPKRPPGSRKAHPDRHHRVATLQIRGVAVTLRRPKALAGEHPDTLDVHVVEVVEHNPAPDVTPIRWALWTNLPIKTPADLERVVDIYRRRWVIEELFRALKTGCAYPDRQAESLDALLRTHALLLPIAVQLLNLRVVAATDPKAACTTLLSKRQVDVIRASRPDLKLTTRSNARDAMLAIATLGGHLKSNGDPGWLVLGRGLRHVLELEAGWAAALHAMAASAGFRPVDGGDREM
jgi:hypothetical protein